MAKKPATRKPAPVEDIEADEVHIKQSLLHDTAYTADEISPALESFYVQHGIDPAHGEASVNVSLLDENGKDVNVWRGPFDDYDLHQIAKNFGSGQYRIRLFVRDGENLGAPLRGNVVIGYKLSPQDERALRIMRAKIDEPVLSTVQSGDNDMRAMMREMMAGFQQSIAQILTGLKQPERDPLTTLEGVKQIAEIMRPATPVTPQRTVVDALQEMKMLADLSKTLNPVPIVGEDGKVSESGLLAKAIDMFGAVATAGKTVPVAQPEALAPVQSIEPLDNQPDYEEDAEMFKIVIRAQLKSGVLLAKNGANAEEIEEYADTVYNLMPDASIAGLVNDAEWFRKLCEIESSCANYPAFFNNVRDLIVQWAIHDGLTPPTNAGSLPAHESPSAPVAPAAPVTVATGHTGTHPG